MDSLTAFLELLKTMSPLAVIALLGVVILLLVRGNRQVTSVKENDLHHLPEILTALQRIEVSLADNFSWIRSRLNGR